MIQVIESVLVINPGVLSKRKAPGTYAQIFLHKRELNEEEQSANRVAHEIFSRARVDITRI